MDNSPKTATTQHGASLKDAASNGKAPDRVSARGLSGVPETLLLPLYHRARDAQRPHSINPDPKAVELLGRIDYDFSKFSKPRVMFPIRARRVDELVRGFLCREPNATVVYLGAGLDTMFFRVDNGRVTWYDIDLPESIALRREFFAETARHHMIARSALDFAWMDEVAARIKDEALIFVAPGLLMYFPPDEVKRLITTLATRFPGAEMVFDTVSPHLSQLSQQGQAHLGDFQLPPMPWGIEADDLPQLTRWHSNITVLSCSDLIAGYRRHYGLLGLLAFIPSLRRKLHTGLVHLRFVAS